MKAHLFYTFLVIFAATAAITLLGVTDIIAIREGYLTALVSAFLIELAGAVIAIFRSANFFSPEGNLVCSDEKVWTSIRKLDAAFGNANDRLNAQAVHFQSRLLAMHHLGPTPRTDIMALATQIGSLIGKTPPTVIDEALGVIADIMEKGVHLGSSERATLVSLCKRLPAEFSGSSSRLLHALDDRKA